MLQFIGGAYRHAVGRTAFVIAILPVVEGIAAD